MSWHYGEDFYGLRSVGTAVAKLGTVVFTVTKKGEDKLKHTQKKNPTHTVGHI